MRVLLFAFYLVALILATQRATQAPLAYFTFFPFGFLTAFYFYSLRNRLFFMFTLVSLGLSYLLSGQGPPALETYSLGGISIVTFGFLWYSQRVWERVLEDGKRRRQIARSELVDLQAKHQTRIESLHHLEKQVASLINLFEIARDFNECLDLKGTVQILYKKVLPELHFERLELILLDPGQKTPAISKVFLVNSAGIEEKVSLDPQAVEHQWVAKAFEEKGFCSLADLWFFPLILDRNFNSLFIVQGAAKEDLAKFEVLASQLALQVRKVRLYEMVRELSILDGLTGVFVRRHFLERFEEEIRRALRQNFPLSVLMLDIDHFKRYNDDFGHLVGDATLREVAQVVRTNIRNVDIVARYGGEEFVVTIPETQELGAYEVAERIRSAIARRSFRIYDEETKVTVSIGISVFPQDLEDLDRPQGGYDPQFLFELLQRADRALYRAKEEGRNRVILYRSLGGK